MSWQATAFVVVQTRAPSGEQLTRDEKLMLMLIADHHDPRENSAYPSVERLAELSLMSKRHAIDVLHALERKESITIERGGGRGRTARYRIVGFATGLPLSQSARRAQSVPQKNLPERMQERCTAEPKSVQKRCTDGERHKEEPTEPLEPNELSTAGAALRDWLSIKKDLEGQLSLEEYTLWLRPAYLLKPMGRDLLIALPASLRIIEAARAHLPKLSALAARLGYIGVHFTRYPDDGDRERIRREYPNFYSQMFGNAPFERRSSAEAAPALHTQQSLECAAGAT